MTYYGLLFMLQLRQAGPLLNLSLNLSLLRRLRPSALLHKITQMATGTPFSLYLHIPYCVSKCPYCDFNSHVVPTIPERAYTEALLKELKAYAATDDWRRRTVQSIFFGGGTPSTFRPKSIGRILETISAQFTIAPDCEITLEANPGTVDRQSFVGYRACGINRISVGIQSFQPRLLKFLGRVHSADDGQGALNVVRRAGFENFNLDLIYASPSQTLEEVAADLETALSFDPPHLSAYNLTFEEGTPFGREFHNGKLAPLAEDEEIAMADLIAERLASAGLPRYEISTYARPGFHCRHNVNYWDGGEYLGVGAGAHSYKRLERNERGVPIPEGELSRLHAIYGRRWWNEKNPTRYMNCVEAGGQAVAGSEPTDLRSAAGEFMFSGLRLTSGICLSTFGARFGIPALQLYPKIPEWLGEELMEMDGDRLRLTRRGLLLADSIFAHFV
jgi:putative oxygen-independent coproporphyrinogen III oxidase